MSSSTLLLLLLLVLSLSLSLSLPSLSLSFRPWPHHFQQTPPFSPSLKYEGSSNLVNLRYHMGPVLTANLTVHPIWYGRWPRSHKHIIRSFLSSLSPPQPPSTNPGPTVSAWWRTVRLYSDQTGANVSGHLSLGSELSLSRYPHGRRLTRLSLQSVIASALSAPRRPPPPHPRRGRRPLPADPRGGLYLLLTAPDVAVQDFCSSVCGFHYFTFPSLVGYTLPYAWIGNSALQCPGICAYPFAVPSFAVGLRRPERPPNGDVGVDGMISVIGHELAEMASNPLVNAWYAGEDPSFPTEIADLCEGIYGTGGGGTYTGEMLRDEGSGAVYNLNGVGGRRFLVQWLWHPYFNYCTGPNAVDQ